MQHNHRTRKYKVGLVLAGGGAKGAYQIGVWKALQEKGIEVDVVSGSSIGALNAALIVSGDWAKANQLWLKLSTLQLVRLSPFFLLSIILNFIHAFFNPIISDRAFSGGPTPAILNRRRSVVITPITIFILLLMGIVFSSLKGDWRLLLFPLIFLALPVLSAATADYLNLSVLRPTSLKRLLNKSVDWKAITASQIPIHVTISRWVFRYSYPMIAMMATLPDNPRDTEICDPKLVEYIRRTRWRAHDGVELAPFYPVLNERTTEDAKAHVLASMAFPAGVLGKVKIGKFRYMDGGAYDNTPIYPLLPYQCEKIFVVHLRPNPREGGYRLTCPRQLRLRMNRIDYLMAHIGQPRYDEEILYGPYPRMIHIVPSKSLGSSIFGTFHFSQKKSERLIEQGYRDTFELLKKL